MSRRTDGRDIAWGHRHGPKPGSLFTACLVLVATACGVPPDRGGDVAGTPIEHPVPMPALVLTDTEGQAFDLRRKTRGSVTLLFFGYTNCPDVCPVHMATLGAAFGNLEPEVRAQLEVLFVSTDAERDTPEVLRAWLDTFDRSFVGLRGSLDEINAALADLQLPGVAVMPSEHMDAPPVIGHPSAIVAFGRNGLARYRYSFGTRSADWLRDLPRLVEEL